MYAKQNKRNVTYIDDLPDLEDIESRPGMYNDMIGVDNTQLQYQGHQGDIPDKFKKFIRNPMGPPPISSGMNPYSQQQQQQQINHQQEFFTPQQQQQQQQQQYSPMYAPMNQQDTQPIRPYYNSPTCLEIADHVGSCPICSRFYMNDKTAYIIAIVILSIICILLLKRVLNL